MADLDYDSALAMSASAMTNALGQDLEPAPFAIVQAIDSLRLALIATERDLVAALEERAALAAGTQVSGKSGLWSMYDDTDDDDDDLTMATAMGYHCTECDFHILIDDPDYDSDVDIHEAWHAGVHRGAEIAVDSFLGQVTCNSLDTLITMVRAALPSAAVEMARVIGMEP